MIYNVSVAPFLGIEFYVTDTFWADRDGTPHRGVDLDPSGQENYPLYSMLDGTVIASGYNDSAGNYLIIKADDIRGTATRYLHLDRFAPNIRTGVVVRRGQLVGYEGDTGYSFGIHLHLEMKYMGTSNTWIASNIESDYINPCEWMGFPNVIGTAVICGATPPTPTSNYKNKFKWVLYSRKIRNKMSIY